VTKLDSEYVVDFQISRHAVVIDIEEQAFGDLSRFLRDLFGKLRDRSELSGIVILKRRSCALRIAEIVRQLRTEPAMLGDELRLFHDLLNAFVFGQAQAFEAFVVMHGVFFRPLDWRGFQHLADVCLDGLDALLCVDPRTVQDAVIVGRQADGIIGRHIAPGASAPNAVTPITCGKEGTSGQNKEKTVMKYFAGIDVSLNESSVCVVDESGAIIREGKVPSEIAPLVDWFDGIGVTCERIGLEAAPLSQHLHEGMAAAGLSPVCIETRHVKAVLSASINKTDRNDARGIAQMMRVGLYKPVHVKTQTSQEQRVLLTSRKFIVHKRQDVENEIRGALRNFGLKIGNAGRARFEVRVRELVQDNAFLRDVVGPLLEVRHCLREQEAALHKQVLRIAHRDPVCRRLMTAPGVGPIVALTFRATVDVPARFARSKSVGAHFGMTPKTYQSGTIDVTGRISKCGDGLVRVALFEAANTILTRIVKWFPLKAWAMNVAKRRGAARAKVALARRLSVILHRMWVDGADYNWGNEPCAA